ncbi:DUF951 domain-containing protein [Christensenella tenuis]|jgi:hypothetical protein|uniref:DUF951 domain-containing protein n=1 Tax=Christensenella tenuis TaxID=2763033 RepID=A0ABR7EBT7_9FIRM|nr:DUF951 domain-containing protein [Christensenella tenuis]MBC5646821.1 DUF951 domain-containing protein [Christensenella tenuis]
MAEKISCGDIVVMQKKHPCGSDRWQVLRTGADIKLKCLGCGHIVMLDYAAFIKRMKKVLIDEQ